MRRLVRWLLVFLAGIVLFFWGEKIGDVLEITVEKSSPFLKEKIWDPTAEKFFSIFEPEIPKVTQDPILQTLFSIGVIFFCIIIFFLLLYFLIFLCFIGLFLLIIKGIGWVISDGLMRMKDFSPTGYFLSLFTLAYISTRLFYENIFFWFCQVSPEIFARIFLVKWLLNKRNNIKVAEKEIEVIPEDKYLVKENEIEKLQARLIKLEKENPGLLNLLSEIIPELKYEGWCKEIRKRWKIKESTKTIKISSDYLKEGRKVFEEALNIIKTLKELKKERKRLNSELERVDLEEEVTHLRLQKEKKELELENIRLEKEIEKIKGGPSQTPQTFKEKFFQKTKEEIERLEARGAGLKMAQEAKEKALSDPELQKYPELYRAVENMFDDYIIRSFLERNE